MTSAPIDLALLYVALFSVILLIIRLAVTRLFKVYPAFFAFLCVCAVLQGAAIVFGVSDRLYFFTYIILQPVRIFLSGLVVWELFRVIFKNYAGLRSLSEWAMGVAAGIALFGFVLSLVGSGAAFKPSPSVQMLLRIERGVDMGLVIFVLIMLYFVSRYPIKLPRNNVAHTILYSIWFLGDAGILLASSFLSRPVAERLVNTGQTLFEIGCYLGWILLLSKEGEHRETQVRKPISAETEKALIIELDSLNQMLERAGRSIFRQ
jgi:hypothetical protein